MKKLLVAAGTVLLIGVGLARSFARNMGERLDHLYDECATAMNDAPAQAKKPCQAYLAHAPSTDSDRIQFVKDWLLKYDQLKSYISFSSLAPDPNLNWFIFEPDIFIDLPEVSKTGGRFDMQISRSFAGPKENALLKVAEAVYPGSGPMIQGPDLSMLCKQDIKNQVEPVWGRCGNDNIEMTEVVTARAVRYYYDLTILSLTSPLLPSGFRAQSTEMIYTGEIRWLNNYSHANYKFKDVYVADLTLQWGFDCGSLCGVGFTRNKVVVLDGQGKVLAMYLDAPVNNQSWVS